MSSRLLPCRHVFFLRKALSCENIIPTQLLNPRWLLATLRSDSAFEVVTSQPFSVGRVLPETSTVWDSNRKFREAHVVAATISEYMSGLGMIEYKLAMKALRSVVTLFKHGEFDAIPAAGPVHDEFSIRPAPTAEEEEEEGEDNVELFGSLQVELGSDDEYQLGPASQSSTELVQLGTELVQTGTELDQSAQLGTGSVQSVQSGTESIEVVNTANIGDGEAEFDLQSPPKAKGRPKQKPKAVKAKRNLNIAMVQEDLEMYEKQLNLTLAFEFLSDNPTFNSAQGSLLQFNLFVFATKPKPPIAHDMRKLPATKALMRPDEIVRIFPMDLIRKCGAKVSAFQRKSRGVRELDIALEIVGVGVFANSTIKLMKKWHDAAATFRKIARALAWIANLDLSNCGDASYSIEEEPALPSKLRQIELLTPQMDVLALAGKELITDEVMHKTLAKLLGCKPNIAVFDSSTLGIVVDGSVNTSNDIIREALAGLTTEKVLIPVNCNGNHWCAIMMDLEGGTIYVYDSSSSSYVLNVRAVAQKMVVLLPPSAQKPFRVRVFEAGLGVQTDSYNCGIYVLLAFEMFCGAKPLGHLDKKTLQRLRYRYLCACL